MRLFNVYRSFNPVHLAVLTVVLSVVVFRGNVAGVAQESSMPEVSACDWLVTPAHINSEQQGDVIVIGALSDRPYLVVLPHGDTDALALVRRCIPDAFLTQSRLGNYIQAGAFRHRSEAHDLARVMSREGFRPRVIHRRGITSLH